MSAEKQFSMYGKGSSQFLLHFKWQKLAAVMVWAAVGDDGSELASLFIEEGVKINTTVYL